MYIFSLLWQRSTGQHSNATEWEWVETEEDIRNQARNAQTSTPSDAYYGIRGIPQQSNRVVAVASCLLILLGCGYFYLGFK